jgi:hypothetical protein
MGVKASDGRAMCTSFVIRILSISKGMCLQLREWSTRDQSKGKVVMPDRADMSCYTDKDDRSVESTVYVVLKRDLVCVSFIHSQSLAVEKWYACCERGDTNVQKDEWI